jgi:glucose dehydrogenase
METMVGGRKVEAVLHCGKAGWWFGMDRATGKLLFRSDEFVRHQNTYNAWNSNMPQAPQGVVVAPGGSGGVDFSPVSLDPGSGIVYVAAIHRPKILTLEKIPNSPGYPALFKMDRKAVPISQGWGTLTALDVKNGGHTVWQVETPAPLAGGALATADGLVCIGETNGHFDAFDSATGKALWTYQTGANVGAPAMSYSVNGRQYIAVATGNPATPAVRAFAGTLNRAGGAIIVFARRRSKRSAASFAGNRENPSPAGTSNDFI